MDTSKKNIGPAVKPMQDREGKYLTFSLNVLFACPVKSVFNI